MKFFWHDPRDRLSRYLDMYRQQPVIKYDKSSLREDVSVIKLPPMAVAEMDTSFLFRYEIFPPDVMSSHLQWQQEEREMRVGDTIVQCVRLPFLKPLPRYAVFGVRIKELINEQNRKGFSYETLEGHAEKGLARFILEQDADTLTFKIHTYSAPGTILSRVMAPVFSRWFQVYCTNKALAHVAATISYR